MNIDESAIKKRLVETLHTLPFEALSQAVAWDEKGHRATVNWDPEQKRISGSVKIDAAAPYQVSIDVDHKRTSCSCGQNGACSHAGLTIREAIRSLPALVTSRKEIAPKSPAISQPAAPPQKTQVKESPEVAGWLQKFTTKPHDEDPTPKKTGPDKRFGVCFKTTGYDSRHRRLAGDMQVIQYNKNGQRSRISPSWFKFEDLYNESRAKLLTREEKELLLKLMLELEHYSPHSNHFILDPSTPSSLILELIRKVDCYFERGHTPLIQGRELATDFKWSPNQSKLENELTLELPENVILIHKGDPLLYFHKKEQVIGEIKTPYSHEINLLLIESPKVPLMSARSIHEKLSREIPNFQIPAPPEMREEMRIVPPKGVLEIDILDYFPPELQELSHLRMFEELMRHGIAVIPQFAYENQTIGMDFTDKHLQTLNDECVLLTIPRDLEAEKELLQVFATPRWEEEHKKVFLYRPSFSREWEGALDRLISEEIPRLKESGWEVRFSEQFPFQTIDAIDDVYLDLNQEGGDWFNAELGTTINGQKYDMIPVLKHILEQGKSPEEIRTKIHAADDETQVRIQYHDRLLLIPAKKLKQLLDLVLLDFGEHSDGKRMRIDPFNASLLKHRLDTDAVNEVFWRSNVEPKDIVTPLLKSLNCDDILKPKEFGCELRPYQNNGLKWLQALRNAGINGILADDMGLGKTVQTLAHIQMEKEEERLTHPALIVAPTSVLPNWAREIARFTPNLKVLRLHGNNRAPLFQKIPECDIVLTTYPLIHRDIEELEKIPFHILILDEAQNVKNAATKAHHALRKIQTNHRICLSGTPMENHLGELWSLFHLLMPGFLGDDKTFRKLYRNPIEKGGDNDRKQRLAKRIQPFVLRRSKELVAHELPEKNIIIQEIEFSEKEQDLYEVIRLKVQQKVMREIEDKGMARSQICILDGLLKLRQVCCDARLIPFDKNPTHPKSSKLEWIRETVPEMVQEGRKILIFSQFAKMLDLIAQTLEKEGVTFTTLTGQTKDRETPVTQFQGGHVPVMLISLKAGGVGLNLTEADTVIHYDPWWNPAAENQATDRAHRIGQTKKVFVYKLIVQGSLEEKILKLQDKKKRLISAFMSDQSNEKWDLSMEDLQEIFAPISATV